MNFIAGSIPEGASGWDDHEIERCPQRVAGQGAWKGVLAFFQLFQETAGWAHVAGAASPEEVGQD